MEFTKCGATTVPGFRPELSDYAARRDEMYCQPGPRAWLLALVCAGSALPSLGLRVAFSTSRMPRTVRSRLAPPVMRTNETGVGTSPKVGTTGDFGTSALQRCAPAGSGAAQPRPT